MKKTMFIKVVCICLLTIVSFHGVCYAEDKEDKIRVEYKATYDDIVPTDVSIVITTQTNAYGTIYDGETALGVGETIYQIKHKDTKTFRIRPVFGYDVDKVIYDGEDITDKLRLARSILKNYLITIEGKGHDAELRVTFKKIGEEPPEEPENPDNPEDPNTPDTPGKPDNPDDPNTPDTPGKPDNPSDPDNPGKPGTPGNPENPENPEDPSNPEVPNQPDDSGSVDIPAQPSDPGNSSTPNDSNTPNTGDWTNINGYIAVVFAAIVVIITALLMKRRNDEKK